jgi:glutamate formiminotransferase / formiminotetrahydrofolate cyclodeaminase
VKLFECVPNFSEGRDAAKIEGIAAEGRSVAGVTVLDIERNSDHNRSVISLVGPGDALSEAVFRMIRTAIQTIDLNHHKGEHPRMGAVDVVPFIPLGEATTEEAVALARALGTRVWNELKVPVYLYAEAAQRPDHQDLAVLRHGEFEGIRASIGKEPERAPDIGNPVVHPTAGIVAIGARPILIAYNAYLTTPDVGIAKKVARAVRARDGGLAAVKALGFDIKERHRAQVSMNLTDYRLTPIHRALEFVRREAARYGTAVEESEIVGLVPEDALLDAAEFYLQLNSFDRSAILDRRLRSASGPSTQTPATLAEHSLPDLADRISARTPTPGGGSAAAAVAALGVALAEMVLRYSMPKDSPDGEIRSALDEMRKRRTALLAAVDDDARAFDNVQAARRREKQDASKTAGSADWSQAIRRAAEVPLGVARHADDATTQLNAMRPRLNSKVASDITAALALLGAARVGALANVEINLEEMSRRGVPAEDLRKELARLTRPA